MRVAVVAEASGGTSGTVDYARELSWELARRGMEETVAGDADVVVFNHAPYAAGVYLGWWRSVRGAASLTRRGVRLVVVFHEIFRREDDRLRMRVFERLQRWSFRELERRAERTVVSDGTRRAALLELVPGAREPEVVPVGPNLPVPTVAPGRAPAPRAVTFGLLQADRDLETLIRAAALLGGRVPGFRLAVVGDLSGDLRRAEALRGLAAELAGPVDFTGRVSAEQVAHELGSARVFVSTYTRRIGFGSGTLAAAFAHGLATVVYEGVDLDPELHPGTHVLPVPRDPESVAAGIELALSGAGDGLGAEARRLYEERLAWERIGDRFAELLAAIPPGSRAQPRGWRR